MTHADRFWSKVDKSGECWLWTGAVDRHGYPQFHWQGRTVYAHRLSYQWEKGEIPSGMDIDHRHTCPKVCVHPDHLRPATRKQNQENRPGAQSNSSSGVRGVYWQPTSRKWMVKVKHRGQQHYGGIFADIEDATEAAIALRCLLFTHNDADREVMA